MDNHEIKAEVKNAVIKTVDLVCIIINIMIFVYFGYLFFTGMLGFLSDGKIFQKTNMVKLIFYFICVISTVYNIFKL